MSHDPIARFDADVASDTLIAALDRDGCAIVEGALSPAQLAGLNADLDARIDATPPGCPNHHPAISAFMGADTVRIDGLPGKSPTFVDVVQNPLLLSVADHYLLPSCVHYLLSTAQLIEIRPGQGAQDLHRDDQAWMHHPKHASVPGTAPQIEVEAMYALSDFSEANGGTRVVPGSHRWPLDRMPQPEEIFAAEMPAGSALVYLGATLHGGGPNATSGTRRRGMFTGFVVGWLRTEENFFLSTPIDAVRTMPERVQQLLGYENHLGIGVVDVGSPRARLTSA